jgi:hypothetical protein
LVSEPVRIFSSSFFFILPHSSSFFFGLLHSSLFLFDFSLSFPKTTPFYPETTPILPETTPILPETTPILPETTPFYTCEIGQILVFVREIAILA